MASSPDRDPRGPLQKSFLFGDGSDTATPVVLGPADAIVHRIRPPVKAHGGKYYLARQIVPILLGVREKITEYLEPCVFGGSVFLAMPRFQREILGDINPNVVSLWTVLSDSRSAGELSDCLRDISYNRPTFEAAKQRDAATIIEQTTRFLIRCRFSRGGLGKDFAWSERQRGGRPGDENAWETFRDTELPKIVGRARGVEVTSEPCWWTVWPRWTPWSVAHNWNGRSRN